MNRTFSSRSLTGALTRIVLAGLVVLPAAGAMAQAAAPSAAPPPPSAQPGAPMQPGLRGGHHDPARMQAHMEKRQAELKGKLRLSPEQEPAWSAFTAAMKPPAPPARPSADQRADMQKLTTPERIDKMRAERSQRMADMGKLMDQRGEATKAFYSALTPEQKKTFDAETVRGRDQMHGRGRGEGHGPRG